MQLFVTLLMQAPNLELQIAKNEIANILEVPQNDQLGGRWCLMLEGGWCLMLGGDGA